MSISKDSQVEEVEERPATCWPCSPVRQPRAGSRGNRLKKNGRSSICREISTGSSARARKTKTNSWTTKANDASLCRACFLLQKRLENVFSFRMPPISRSEVTRTSALSVKHASGQERRGLDRHRRIRQRRSPNPKVEEKKTYMEKTETDTQKSSRSSRRDEVLSQR